MLSLDFLLNHINTCFLLILLTCWEFGLSKNFLRSCCDHALMFPDCLSFQKYFCLWQNCWKKAQHCHIFVDYRQVFFQLALEVGEHQTERWIGLYHLAGRHISLPEAQNSFLLEKENHCAGTRQLDTIFLLYCTRLVCDWAMPWSLFQSWESINRWWTSSRLIIESPKSCSNTVVEWKSTENASRSLTFFFLFTFVKNKHKKYREYSRIV